jgi:hypothetical protein
MDITPSEIAVRRRTIEEYFMEQWLDIGLSN